MTQTALTFDFEIQTRFRDMNIGHHIDAVECIRLVDEARQRFFSHAVLPVRPEGGGLLGGRREGIGYLVASQKVDHLRELVVDPVRPLLARLWIGRIGSSSFDVSAELLTDAAESERPALRAVISAVMIDREQGGTAPIDPELRHRLEAYLASPTPLRG